jgi:histidinol-phosphate aminotransferase
MMSPHLASVVAALPPSRPFVGPEELARRTGQSSLLRLGANESSFGPPPRALEAMRDAIGRTNFYGDPESLELREALAARHGCGSENITVAAGIDDLLGLAVRAYLAPGDVSVMTLGSYPTYAYHVVGYGARSETVPYAADGTVQLEALARKAHETHARVAYLANPDNPSGAFARSASVVAFRAALPDDTLLILDEAYGDFVSADELPPRTIDPRVVRMRTFSKAYGFAGARIAYCLAAPETIRAFDKIRLQYGVNRTAQIGALAALEETAFVADVVAETARGRDEYATLGARVGCATLPSRTNFVCFDLGSRERAEFVVEALLAAGIFVRKPAAPPLDGHIRVTVGTVPERARFAEAFARIVAS